MVDEMKSTTATGAWKLQSQLCLSSLQLQTGGTQGGATRRTQENWLCSNSGAAPAPASNLHNPRAFLVRWFGINWLLKRISTECPPPMEVEGQVRHGGAAAQTLRLSLLTLPLPDEGFAAQHHLPVSGYPENAHVSGKFPAGAWDGLLAMGKGEQSPGWQPGLADPVWSYLPLCWAQAP